MKKLKATLAVVLAAASILSLSGCAEDTAPSAGQGGGNTITTQGTADIAATSVTTTRHSENKAVQDAVHNMDVTKLDNPDLKVTKRIKWMAWNGWIIDETLPAAELFKQVYGVPTTGDDPNYEGYCFEYIDTAYETRYDNLSLEISSGKSPDIFPFEIRDFPYGILKGRYQPVSDIIDVEGPKWDGARELMEQFRFGDDYYCAFYEISLENVLYYCKSMIEEIGAEDPRTLFEEGKWDWDAFLEISRKWQNSGNQDGIVDNEDDRYCIDGYNPEDQIIISTGVPMVSNNGTALVNNLHDPAVERAEQLLETLQKENLRFPRHVLSGYSTKPAAWAAGQTLFYGDGALWVYESTLRPYAKRFGWAEDEIVMVPFPKDPKADKHYVTCKQDSYMYVVGSENPEGVAAWIDCCVTTAADPEITKAARQQQKDNYGWSDYNLDAYYDEWVTLDGSSPLTFIIDYKGGLGDVSDGSGVENPVQSLTNLVYLTGDQTFAQLRAQHEPQIQAAIDQINEKLGDL